jgi:C-terminal processing protease CtpA/Prc
MIPDLMDPAQVNKLDMPLNNAPLKLKEKRAVDAKSKVSATVTTDDGTPVESINGHKPRDIVDAYAMLLRPKENQKFDVVLSGGKARSITPHATPLPDAVVQAKEKLGLIVEELNPMIAQKYGLIEDEGMLVTQVQRGSIAAKTGIQAGDVITSLGRYPVRSLQEFSNLMKYLPDSGRVRIGITRGGQRGAGVLEM